MASEPQWDRRVSDAIANSITLIFNAQVLDCIWARDFPNGKIMCVGG